MSEGGDTLSEIKVKKTQMTSSASVSGGSYRTAGTLHYDSANYYDCHSSIGNMSFWEWSNIQVIFRRMSMWGS
jgi:hypothetical protein